MGDEDAYEDATAEQRRVELWRRSRFLELGFDRGQAQLLAFAGCDWHIGQKLLEGGCELTVAFDILI